ncbi:MAG: hypothetical protein MN733_35140 [Nitrososphaera sp.]|nr:hypothetical protein [Nitrososphaera sp.]
MKNSILIGLVVLVLVAGPVGCSSRTDPFVPCREKFREYQEANRLCQSAKCDPTSAEFVGRISEQYHAEKALEYCAKAASTVKNQFFAHRLFVLCKEGARQ